MHLYKSKGLTTVCNIHSNVTFSKTAMKSWLNDVIQLYFSQNQGFSVQKTLAKYLVFECFYDRITEMYYCVATFLS